MPDPLTPFLTSKDLDYAAYEFPDGQLVIVDRTPGDARQVLTGHGAVQFVRQVLVARKKAYYWRSRLLVPDEHGKGWQQIFTVPEMDAALHRLCFLCSPLDESAPTDLPFKTNSAPAEDKVDRTPFRQRLEHAGLSSYDNCQQLLCGRFLAGASACDHVAGFLTHPIFGDPAETWLRPVWARPTPPLPDTGDPDHDYPHLTALFSALNLHPVDRAALYSFLFGCFHAVSLDRERPVFFVDSAVRGRGKGEVSTVLAVLLDDRPSALPVSGRPEAVTTKVVSHLISGARVVSCQNVSGRVDWNNEFLVCLSTDDGTKERALYDREATPFQGVVVALSCVYGQATFDRDVVDRSWRVFLHGNAGRLEPRPKIYVRQHRAALTNEIMTILDRATPYSAETHSRFNEFEEVAGAAYAAFTGKSHAEVSNLLKAAFDGALALLTPAVRSCPGVLLHKEIGAFGTDSKSPDLTGARALGLRHDGTDWIAEKT